MPTTNSLSAGSSNIQGDDNRDNYGIIGDGDENIVVSGNNNRLTVSQVKSKNVELAELLYHGISADALPDSVYAPTTCHPGTRKSVRNAITSWVSDSAGSPLLWLHGPAGVGKSVIAKTMSTIPSEKIHVVATFFFSTSSDKTGTTLFPTLAWQLAKNVPKTRQHIVDALKGNPLLPKSELEQQFDLLIIQPLKKCFSTTTAGMVMVIDGVDECVDENMQTKFLSILKRAGEHGRLPLRFLICSRPEPHIRAILETTDNNYPTVEFLAKFTAMATTSLDSPQNPPPMRPASGSKFNNSMTAPALKQEQSLKPQRSHVWNCLSALQWKPRWPTLLPSDARKLCQPMQFYVDNSSHEIGDKPDKIYSRQVISRIRIGLSEESKDDIRMYLTEKFKADTIASEDIEDLVTTSSGQFLYASTIVKLLDDPGWDPKNVLEIARSSSMRDLDKLYRAILDKAQEVIRAEHGTDAETDLMTLRDVFAILVVLWENAQLAHVQESFPIVAGLLALEKGKLERILRKMHSILDINPGKSIHVYHRSFFEFLQHKHKSGVHCVSYPFALRRFLVLLSRFVLRYPFRHYLRKLKNDDQKKAERIRTMVLAFSRNFFKRSANPTKLATFHAWVHTFIILFLWKSVVWFSLDFWDRLIMSLSPPLCVFFVRYFLIMLSFIIAGSSVPFLACHMSYVHQSIIRYPLFHPFLNPFLVKISDFLLPHSKTMAT